ncbi:hypothetical protein V6Z11_A05G373300 [Gossypium hirsutum]
MPSGSQAQAEVQRLRDQLAQMQASTIEQIAEVQRKYEELQQQLLADAAEREAAAAAREVAAATREAEQSRKYDELQLQLQQMMKIATISICKFSGFVGKAPLKDSTFGSICGESAAIAVIHPFAEHIAYFLLFAIPVFTMVLTGAVSVIALAAYVTYLDFMNNMGHSNFELIPNWLFTLLLPLKYIIYTPSFHSPHHVQFKTYYSLFMPFYDYIYGTMDKSSDILYEKSLRRKEESPHVAHLTHLATPESINHLRLGFAPFAFKPYTPSTWHMWFFWPVTPCSMMLTWIYCSTFVVERYRFHNIRLQTSAIPKYNIQLKQSINNLIEEAILEHPQLKVKLVDGSSLAVTVVLNSIPKGTTQVVLRGKLTKVACALAFALCQKRIQVFVLHEDEYEKLDKLLGTKSEGKLVLSKSYTCKTWLVRDGLSEVEQRKASKRTLFIPFSQFPPKQLRTDCFYHTTLMQYYHTLAMQIPLAFENVDSCELSRRVMSIWCIAGLVHALEGWEEHKCGYTTSNIEKLLRFSTHLKS